MSGIGLACNACSTEVTAEFGPNGARTTLNVLGPTPVPGTCCVHDVIQFSGGQLIFSLSALSSDTNSCVVMCRKLIVTGGSSPSTTSPCDPGDPGNQYATSNVITWDKRLTAAQAGQQLSPTTAATGSGVGVAGAAGAQGNTGSQGAANERVTLTIVALDVEIASGSKLLVDWAGQDGGTGGPGQIGGTGGPGTSGSNGTEQSWPSSGCGTPPGNGGQGASGGPGGTGGTGGAGGVGGPVVVIGTAQSLQIFQNQVSFVNTSLGGKAGDPGAGGKGGAGGKPGIAGLCSPGADGPDGPQGPDGNLGSAGASNQGPVRTLQQLTPGSCADSIPIPLTLPANYPQQTIYRCISGSGSADLPPIVGQNFDQVASVSTSLAGVTASIDPSSTDTQLVLKIMAAANSATGPGNLAFNYLSQGSLGPQTLPGAINVEIWGLATAIVPNSGAQGATVNVTINGSGFDPSSVYHDVEVSGTKVTSVNVAVVSDAQITCTFEIDPAATAGTRDVTVSVGASSSTHCDYTFVQSFTVT